MYKIGIVLSLYCVLLLDAAKWYFVSCFHKAHNPFEFNIYVFWKTKISVTVTKVPCQVGACVFLDTNMVNNHYFVR